MWGMVDLYCRRGRHNRRPAANPVNPTAGNGEDAVCFPLTWEYEFTRDITSRGAGFWDIAPEFGGFLIYFACLIIVFCLVFYGTRPRTSSNTAKNTRRT